MGEIPLGTGGLAVLVAYLLGLIGIGVLGRMRRQEESLADHYLAGRDLGFFVLLLTLFATQYSGNTLFGFTGKAYRMGYAWIMSVHAMQAVVVGYLVFAPGLYRATRRGNIVTPGDYLHQRYGSEAIRVLGALVMIFATANYTFAQLKVMGLAVHGLSGGAIQPIYGVLGLAAVMVFYETLGGMRSVSWTDMIQGVLLLVGFTLLFFLVLEQYGSLPETATYLRQHAPEKIAVPDGQRCAYWLSMVILVGVGASIYPHAIQRIYAARNVQTLKRSLRVMLFFPFVTTFVVLVVGLIALKAYPDLSRAQSDQVLGFVCRDLLSSGPLGYWTVVVILAALVAALMSTADSSLLSLSSIVTRDLYGAYLRPQASEKHLTTVGKGISWIVLALLVWFSTGERLTLVRLLEIKFEVLLQIAPAFYLGATWKRLDRTPVLAGLGVGLAIALGLVIAGIKLIGGFHAGVVALAANLATVWIVALWKRDRSSENDS